jgi:twitching motility protein PilU
MKRSTEHGMVTFDQCLYDLYRKGEITYEDAVAHADSQNEVRIMIKLGVDGKTGQAARGAVNGQELMERSGLVKKVGLVGDDDF